MIALDTKGRSRLVVGHTHTHTDTMMGNDSAPTWNDGTSRHFELCNGRSVLPDRTRIGEGSRLDWRRPVLCRTSLLTTMSRYCVWMLLLSLAVHWNDTSDTMKYDDSSAYNADNETMSFWIGISTSAHTKYTHTNRYMNIFSDIVQ